MESARQRILLVGDDSELLRTRARVLHTLGVSVNLCAPEEVAACLERDAFNLVILCHTLDYPARLRVGECVHELAPDAYVLQLTGIIDPFTTIELPEHIDDLCPPEPDPLLKKVRSVLRKQR